MIRETATQRQVLGRAGRRAGLVIAAGAFLVVGATGCAERSAPKVAPQRVEAPPVPDDFEHRVGPGETLAAIATWYTGKPTNWAQIKAANPGLNPHRLRLGQVILIPGNMVTRREPMPRSFMKAASKAGSSSNRKPPESVRLDENTGRGMGEVIEKPIDLDQAKPEVDVGDVQDFKRDEVAFPPPPSTPDVPTARDVVVDSLPPPSTGTPKADAPKAGNGSDAEREKLLDELLSQ